MEKFIIDISEFQDPNNIDYDKLCSQLDMAIIRVQYGSRYEDKVYKTHIQKMKEHGIPFGVYAWVRGISNADMEQEARDFYNRSKDLNPMFYALDVEEQSMSDMRNGVSAYITELRKYTDKRIGIYIANHLYESFNLKLDEANFVWIPAYGVNNGQVSVSPKFYCDLHQYTSTGKLDGYNGNLDVDRLMNGRNIEFFTGVKEQPIIAEPTPTPQPRPSQPRTWLQLNDTGDRVKDMQFKLIRFGFNCGGYGADGNFGNSTLASLKAFQSQYRLSVDGYFGQQSQTKIDSLIADLDKPKPTPTQPQDNSALIIQQKLNRLHITDRNGNRLMEDNSFGDLSKSAVIKFEQIMGLSVDNGSWGNECENMYQKIIVKPLIQKSATYNQICRYIQWRIGTSYDGLFGSNSCYKLKVWQSSHGLVNDAICGNATWNSMIG